MRDEALSGRIDDLIQRYELESGRKFTGICRSSTNSAKVWASTEVVDKCRLCGTFVVENFRSGMKKGVGPSQPDSVHCPNQDCANFRILMAALPKDRSNEDEDDL